MPTEIRMDEADVDRRVAAAKASRALDEEREDAARAEPQASQPGSLLYSPAIEHNPGAPAHVVQSYAAQIRPVNEPRVVDTSRMYAQEIRMPDTSMEPTPTNSVKVGTLVVFHSDDGGPYSTSRNQVQVVEPDGKKLKGSDAFWRLFEELKQIAEAARDKK
jgi:hypothetical protein